MEFKKVFGVNGEICTLFIISKDRVKKFVNRDFQKKIDYKKIGEMSLAFSILLSISSACNRKEVVANPTLETAATETAYAKAETLEENKGIITEEKTKQTSEYINTPSVPVPTVEQESSPLKMDFGIESKVLPVVNGVDADTAMKKVAEKYANDYPFQYFVYVQNGESRVINWSNEYKPIKVGATFSEQLGIKIKEQNIFERIMEMMPYSDYSVAPCYQKVIYVTEEEGNDGVIRNGFFSYSEYGIAIYIKANGAIYVYDGDYINIDDPEVRNIFDQGYTQVRIVNGQAKGFFNIDDLTSKNSTNK